MSEHLAPALPGPAPGQPGLASAPAAGPAGARPPATSYRASFTSASIIAGASLLTLAIGMLRTKAVAVLLGPAGLGLMGAFVLIADLARTLAQLGINASGVRQIAEAAASRNNAQLARTVTLVRWLALACCLPGGLLLVMASGPVSTLTFGDAGQAGAVALLALAVVFSLLAGGQGAVLQGLQRIGDQARAAIWGAMLGALFSLPILVVLRDEGIVLSIIALAVASLLATWWYGRRVEVCDARLTLAQGLRESAPLLGLGLAFLGSGLLTLGAAYGVRIIVLRQCGIEAAGVYQAAWTLGGLYVGFILQALGTDFYPRLVGVSASDPDCNRMVNEQTRMNLLLAGPGIIATLTGAQLGITWLYSSAFVEAVDILRWICLGMALRVMTWPMSFIIVARNRQLLFFAADLAWTLVYLGLTWVAVRHHDAAGAGMAFFASYVFHACLIYPLVRRLSGFAWSPANTSATVFYLASIGAVFMGFQLLAPQPAMLLGAAVLLLSTAHAVRGVAGLVASHPVSRLLAGRRPAP